MGCLVPTSDFDYRVTRQSVSFTGISSTAASWHWNFGDGYYSNLADPWHEYETMGNFEVYLTKWNGCGTDTLCYILHMSTVSIPENNQENFIIYPTPARDAVYINSSVSGNAGITMLDLSGKEVLRAEGELMASQPFLLDLTGISPGI